MKEYNIPINLRVSGTVSTEADSIWEAIDKVRYMLPDIGLIKNLASEEDEYSIDGLSIKIFNNFDDDEALGFQSNSRDNIIEVCNDNTMNKKKVLGKDIKDKALIFDIEV